MSEANQSDQDAAIAEANRGNVKRESVPREVSNSGIYFGFLAGLQHERTQAKELVEALETCSPGDYSTGHVINPSFDEALVAKALAKHRARMGEG